MIPTLIVDACVLERDAATFCAANAAASIPTAVMSSGSRFLVPRFIPCLLYVRKLRPDSGLSRPTISRSQTPCQGRGLLRSDLRRARLRDPARAETHLGSSR